MKVDLIFLLLNALNFQNFLKSLVLNLEIGEVVMILDLAMVAVISVEMEEALEADMEDTKVILVEDLDFSKEEVKIKEDIKEEDSKKANIINKEVEMMDKWETPSR